LSHQNREWDKKQKTLCYQGDFWRLARHSE
jgi:hypothetical protein